MDWNSQFANFTFMNVTREEFIKIIVDKVLAKLAENKEFLQKDISDENGI